MKEPAKPYLATENRAFFGRRAGKRLHAGQQALFNDLLPQIAIDHQDQSPIDPQQIFPDLSDDMVLEIGYGGGEHLAHKASENPQTSFIGAEVYTGGIGKMLEKIEDQNLSNVRLYAEDALGLLKRFPSGCLSEIYLLYPDPWPKNRHHKRRFVSQTTLSEIARTLRPGGFFHFATDIEDYANWTLAHILRAPGLTWPLATMPVNSGADLPPWHQPYPGWQPTRYEQKARREGRNLSFYFSFTTLES